MCFNEQILSRFNPTAVSSASSVCQIVYLLACTGDLMSPPNLDNLLVVPYGCGEQNLVKTTNNFVVANYLDSTEQLTEAIAARVRVNIMKGEGCGRALGWVGLCEGAWLYNRV